jgi:hypothetical protein
MEAMAQEWTDGRLDDLSKKVDRGFEQVDNEVHALRVEMRTEFSAVRAEMNGMRAEMHQDMSGMRAEMGAIHERIGSVQHTIAYGAIAMAGAILAGFAGICTLIATTL